MWLIMNRNLVVIRAEIIHDMVTLRDEIICRSFEGARELIRVSVLARYLPDALNEGRN